MGGMSKLKTVFLSPPPSSCKCHSAREGRGEALSLHASGWSSSQGSEGTGLWTAPHSHDRLEEPLGPGSVGRCGRCILYVPIINLLALTVLAGLFAFHGLKPGGIEAGKDCSCTEHVHVSPLCGLISGV